MGCPPWLTTSSPCTRSPGSIRPTKEVLKDISLNFLPGAKIGILGPNGSGKSSLLKIMAGIDTEFKGEARLREPARTSASSNRSRSSDETRTCAQRRDGVREIRTCSTASTNSGQLLG